MKLYRPIADAGQAFSRRYIPRLTLMLAATFALAANAPAAELVVNGGFEEPIVPCEIGSGDHAWETYYGQNGAGLCAPTDHTCMGGILVPGWNVWWTDTYFGPDDPEPGLLEIQHNEICNRMVVPPSHFGAQKAELDSHNRHQLGDAANNNVTIDQKLHTCPRSRYELTYWWKSRRPMLFDNDVRVFVGATIVREHTLNDDWTDELVYFVSDPYTHGPSTECDHEDHQCPTTDLAFASIGTESTYGMFLDDISVIGETPSHGDDDDDATPMLTVVKRLKDAKILDDDDDDGCSCVGDDDDDDDEGFCDDDDGYLTSLTLLYDGNDVSYYDTGNLNVQITPATVDMLNFPKPAFIKIWGLNGTETLLLEGTYFVGELIYLTFTPGAAPEQLKVEIYDPESLSDPDGGLVQTIQFYIGCDDDDDDGGFRLLDEYGGITIWDGTAMEGDD